MPACARADALHSMRTAVQLHILHSSAVVTDVTRR